MSQLNLNPFDPRSIDALIEQLETVKEELPEKVNTLSQESAERGAEYVRQEMASMVYGSEGVRSGSLLNSVAVRPSPQGGYEIIVLAKHGALVEFGTGPRGANGPQHPELPGGWDYRDTGWGYFDETQNDFVYTYGMSSRPFMHVAFNRLRNELESRGAL